MINRINNRTGLTLKNIRPRKPSVSTRTDDQMGCCCWNPVNLANHIGRNAAIHSQERCLPILRQNGAELFNDDRASRDVGCIVEDGIPQQDDVVHELLVLSLPSQPEDGCRVTGFIGCDLGLLTVLPP